MNFNETYNLLNKLSEDINSPQIPATKVECPRCHSTNVEQYASDDSADPAEGENGGIGTTISHSEFYSCKSCGCRFYTYVNVTTMSGTTLLGGKDDDDIIVTLDNYHENSDVKINDVKQMEAEDKKAIKSICDKFNCKSNYNLDYDYDEDYLEPYNLEQNIVIQGDPVGVLMILKEMLNTKTWLGESTWKEIISNVLKDCKNSYKGSLLKMADDDYTYEDSHHYSSSRSEFNCTIERVW